MSASDRTAHTPRAVTRARGRGERGATLVEMAIVLPLFFLMVFGMFEFSYAVAQNNETRHVAREAARIAGVDGSAGEVVAAITGNLDLIDPGQLSYVISGSTSEEGGTGTVRVCVTYESLTGLLDGLLDGITFLSVHDFFVEPDKPVPSSGSGSC